MGDEVELAGIPSDEDALIVALDAARLVGQAPPSASLLDWLGQVDFDESAWDGRATARLLALLRESGIRSWRFLEASGVLERSLPELAEAIRRRRADPFVLDPANVLRFDLVDALRDIVAADPRAAAAFERLRHPEQPMLAALVLAAAGDGGEPEALARRLADRLRLGVVAEEELVDLVTDRGLMRAAATRLEGLDEEPVLQLAGHLATPERTRALYVLSLALGELETWERDRLDELVSRVLGVLSRPELTGARAGSVVEQRRAEALRLVGDAPGAIARVATRAARVSPRARRRRHRASRRAARPAAAQGERPRGRDAGRARRGPRRGRVARPPGSPRRGLGRARGTGSRRRRRERRHVAGRRRGRVVPRSHPRARVGRAGRDGRPRGRVR